ncbi:MAG: argininosuccinate synthase [Candidatus Sumerlaeota bacterium]|nr:argininosuccinate synthase [Candidatus Sumerlaeota bacterium]
MSAPNRPVVKKCVLAYSGGLDTSVIIRWLIENYHCKVVAYSADLGAGEDLKPLRKKAIATGASKIVIEDLREQFANDYCMPALKMNALYEGRYPMATSLGRPLIAKRLCEVAIAEGADAIAHGCTGKGNDQVRFEVVSMCLAPHLKCLAPVREWEMKTRDEEIEYARKHNIPVKATKKKPFSIDKNLYGCSIECGVLEDPWAAPPEEAYQDSISPLKAPATPEEFTIMFEKGIPVGINGKRMKPVDVIYKCAALGNKHGVGRIDLVENRLVGIKSREVYEAPAPTILMAAHRELESVTLDRATMRMKEQLIPAYAQLIYDGLWFTPLRESLDAFCDKTQERVTGEVRMRLYRGAAFAVGRRSPHSLYKYELATYDAADKFDHTASVGFIKIFGLPSAVQSRVDAQVKGRMKR